MISTFMAIITDPGLRVKPFRLEYCDYSRNIMEEFTRSPISKQLCSMAAWAHVQDIQIVRHHMPESYRLGCPSNPFLDLIRSAPNLQPIHLNGLQHYGVELFRDIHSSKTTIASIKNLDISRLSVNARDLCFDLGEVHDTLLTLNLRDVWFESFHGWNLVYRKIRRLRALTKISVRRLPGPSYKFSMFDKRCFLFPILTRTRSPRAVVRSMDVVVIEVGDR